MLRTGIGSGGPVGGGDFGSDATAAEGSDTPDDALLRSSRALAGDGAASAEMDDEIQF